MDRAIIRLPGAGKLQPTFDTRAEAKAWVAHEEADQGFRHHDRQTGHGVTCGALFKKYEEEVSSHTDSAR